MFPWRKPRCYCEGRGVFFGLVFFPLLIRVAVARCVAFKQLAAVSNSGGSSSRRATPFHFTFNSICCQNIGGFFFCTLCYSLLAPHRWQGTLESCQSFALSRREGTVRVTTRPREMYVTVLLAPRTRLMSHRHEPRNTVVPQ